jgi:protein O-GlcNAc transferase
VSGRAGVAGAARGVASSESTPSQGGFRVSLKQTIQRGISAYEREDYANALATFREVLAINPRFADLRNKCGLCLAMMDDLEGALKEFDAALALNDSYAEAHLNRGIVLNEMGRNDEAVDSFNKAQQLDTRDGTIPSDVGNQLAVLHGKLGDLYVVANHHAEAAQQYEAAIRVRPRYLDIRGKLAEALMEIGESGRAREELEHILERNPRMNSARLRLGVLLQRMGETQRAIEHWRIVAQNDPEDMRARAYLQAAGDGTDGKPAS